jgi:hypothetical protein
MSREEKQRAGDSLPRAVSNLITGCAGSTARKLLKSIAEKIPHQNKTDRAGGPSAVCSLSRHQQRENHIERFSATTPFSQIDSDDNRHATRRR